MNWNKLGLAVLCLVVMCGFSGCLGSASKAHLHTKVTEVELRTQRLVEDNLDEVVLNILKKLNEKLEEKGIEIPDELKDVIVAEAQVLARQYAAKGVEVGFDEIHKLIDKLFPDKSGE